MRVFYIDSFENWGPNFNCEALNDLGNERIDQTRQRAVPPNECAGEAPIDGIREPAAGLGIGIRPSDNSRQLKNLSPQVLYLRSQKQILSDPPSTEWHLVPGLNAEPIPRDAGRRAHIVPKSNF